MTASAGNRAGAELLVCDFPMPASGGARPAAVAELRRLAPDIVVLHGGPSGLRWRSTAAALARETGLLYLDGGGGSHAPMLFVRMRVDTVTTWVRRWPGAPGGSGGAAVGAVLRCSGQVFGVLGARYPARSADRAGYGETLLAALGELRGTTENVVVAVGPDPRADLGDGDGDGDGAGAAARQLAAGGLLSTTGGSASSGSAGIWSTAAVRVFSAGAVPGYEGSGSPPWLARLGVPSA